MAILCFHRLSIFRSHGTLSDFLMKGGKEGSSKRALPMGCLNSRCNSASADDLPSVGPSESPKVFNRSQGLNRNPGNTLKFCVLKNAQAFVICRCLLTKQRIITGLKSTQ